MQTFPIHNHSIHAELKSFGAVCSTMHTIVVWQQETKITYKRFSDSLMDYEEFDQIGKEKGYGHTLFIRSSQPVIRRILETIKDFRSGIFEYKFPVCCVVNFCIDDLLDRPSALLRWSNRTDHIECFVHIRKRGKQVIPLDLY